MIPNKLIATNVQAETWQDAVREAGQLLVNNNLIEPEYIDSMIETVHKHGPYMILAPEICLFHGQPGEMVKEPCVSLVTLADTVYFTEYDNQPIKVAFALGATDSESHLSLLQDVAKLLSDDAFKMLVQSNGAKEEIIKKMEEILK